MALMPERRKRKNTSRMREPATARERGTGASSASLPRTEAGAAGGDDVKSAAEQHGSSAAAPKVTQLDVSAVGSVAKGGNTGVAAEAAEKKTHTRSRRRRKKTTSKPQDKNGESDIIDASREKTWGAGETAGVSLMDARPAPQPSAAARPVQANPVIGSDVANPTGAQRSETITASTSSQPHKGESSGRGRRRGKRGSGKKAAGSEAGRGSQSVKPAGQSSSTEAPSAASEARRGREMVINVSAGDECRIAVLNDGRLEDLFIERASTLSHVGNIYKGRVANVEPSIQAVFVDFGLAKNGFLHISDVQPQYFPNHKGESEDVGRKIPRHNRPPIQKCFRRGQEVIVQVVKEGVGTKGPTLSTYLSIPGRFLVMMPGMSRHGVSRKIEDEATRREMREMLKQLTLPANMGFILRTAGLGQSKRELQRDLSYLTRLWKGVVERIKRHSAPAELYQESDLVKRTIRDVYTSEFTRVVVDDPGAAQRAREFLAIAMPRSKPTIEVYSEREPLFHRLDIENEIDLIHMRHVPLASGGSIVIDSTEALVAIDVNSGRFRSVDDAEESAYRINLEAADEIARQLKLRDLGGLIVCDFIDMRLERHKRAVEKALRDALKRHKEHARALRMSAFGIIEMTRQRQGPSYRYNVFFDCPHCKGAGLVKMPESMTLDVMRFVQLATHNEQVQTVKVTVASDVAFQILNNKRAMITQIEVDTGKRVVIRGEPSYTSDQIDRVCEDAQGRPVQVGRGVLVPHAGAGRGPAAATYEA